MAPYFKGIKGEINIQELTVGEKHVVRKSKGKEEAYNQNHSPGQGLSVNPSYNPPQSSAGLHSSLSILQLFVADFLPLCSLLPAERKVHSLYPSYQRDTCSYITAGLGVPICYFHLQCNCDKYRSELCCGLQRVPGYS